VVGERRWNKCHTDHDDCFLGPIAESDLCGGLENFPTVPAYWYVSEASIMTSMCSAIVDLLLTELELFLIIVHRNGNAGTFKMGVTVTGVCFFRSKRPQIRNVQCGCMTVHYYETLGRITTFFLQEK
jgi:hypothetical protein